MSDTRSLNSADLLDTPHLFGSLPGRIHLSDLSWLRARTMDECSSGKRSALEVEREVGESCKTAGKGSRSTLCILPVVCLIILTL